MSFDGDVPLSAEIHAARVVAFAPERRHHVANSHALADVGCVPGQKRVTVEIAVLNATNAPMERCRPRNELTSLKSNLRSLTIGLSNSSSMKGASIAKQMNVESEPRRGKRRA